MELLDNFKLPMTLTSYNNAGDPTVYVTMFKFLMQLNSATFVQGLPYLLRRLHSLVVLQSP